MSAVRIRECDVVGAVGRLQGGTCSGREGEVEGEAKGEDDAVCSHRLLSLSR